MRKKPSSTRAERRTPPVSALSTPICSTVFLSLDGRSIPQPSRLVRSAVGSVTYVMDKSRLSIRLKRLTASREHTKQPGFPLLRTDKKSAGNRSIHRKITVLNSVFGCELASRYPGIPMPGNATKEAFSVEEADSILTSVASRLLRAVAQMVASPLRWAQGVRYPVVVKWSAPLSG